MEAHELKTRPGAQGGCRHESCQAQRHAGYTALMLAASQGHTKVVLELLEAKADASLSNADGETALMLAHDMISIYRRPAPRARR